MIPDSNAPDALDQERPAMRATEAGAYLAKKLGLTKPFSAPQMWAYARTGVIPIFRIGRLVWFRAEQLDAFVETGGASYPVRQESKP